MRHGHRAVLCSLTLGLFVASAHAQTQFFMGEKLHEWCQRSPDSHLVATYVAGAKDALTLAAELGTVQRECSPAGIALGRLSGVVCKFLRDNPEKRHWPAASLIWGALVGAWPCDK
jgi:hypothetical protein